MESLSLVQETCPILAKKEDQLSATKSWVRTISLSQIHAGVVEKGWRRHGGAVDERSHPAGGNGVSLKRSSVWPKDKMSEKEFPSQDTYRTLGSGQSRASSKF